MYLVERLEDDESHAYGPKSDEHRTEDLCSEEVCACTIEESFAGGEQSGEDCTCETTDAMYGYFRLRPGQLSSVESDLGHNLAVLQEVLRVSKQYNPEFAKPYQEEFDNYRMAYGSVAKD